MRKTKLFRAMLPAFAVALSTTVVSAVWAGGFDNTTSNGFYSNSTNAASGSYSTAMGRSTTASGYYSNASGSYSTASGNFSNAMGR